jgi:nitroimidazol reductase NimA-like FMN-containing flavoprotein (pyridoxamine 5'-phosphate oxidase superfamily)
MSVQPTRVPDPTPERPRMPAIYGLASATSRPGERLPWRRVRQSLATSHLYWVVTVRPDGRPHAMPVEGVWLEGSLYFGAGSETRRGRNLALNPHIIIHLDSSRQAIILEGRAEPIDDPVVLARLTDAWEAKYGYRSDLDEQTGVFVLRPRTGFSMIEKDFVESATRWRFDED